MPRIRCNFAKDCEALPQHRIHVILVFRFVMSFLCFLPFAIWPQLRWLTIPAMGLITFLLVGIENIGIQVSEEFFFILIGIPYAYLHNVQ